MPFEGKYDPLVIAMAKAELKEWLDDTNATAIASANAKVALLKNELIIGAAKNIGKNLQMKSRRGEIPLLAPRRVV